MNSSLRDQLLAAGLVTEKQARQAAQQEQQRQFRDRPRPNPGARPGSNPGQAGGQNKGTAQNKGAAQKGPQQAPSVKAEAQHAHAAKVARDQELNRRREDKAQRRARMAQIEQIIEQNRVPRLETEDYYGFIDGKKIRRMSVDAQRREQLTRGELVIVRYRGHYAVVPAAIAERIRERDANMVVPLVQPKTSSEPDDAYKDFVVPDDLMW
jgi:uncharacterized protein YaiL (DUF2058 family)